MNIIAISKLLKFRIFSKKSLLSFIESDKIYVFGNIESIDKLLSFKKVNFILTDEETAYCYKDFFTNLIKKNKEIRLIIFYINKDFELNKSLFRNTIFIQLNPDTDYSNEDNILTFANILKKHIKNSVVDNKNSIDKKFKLNKPVSKNIKAILIGVSTGGPKALRNLLPELTESTNLPIVIVQHILKQYTDSFIYSLNSISNTEVIKIENGLVLTKNHVFVAPGGIHTTIVKNNGKAVFKLDNSPPEESVKPSVNYLFRSAAEVFGKDAIGIILTGMGHDGTDGARKLSDKGAYLIAQDEKSSDVWSMPNYAIKNGCINKILPLKNISNHIMTILGKT